MDSDDNVEYIHAGIIKIHRSYKVRSSFMSVQVSIHINNYIN